MSQPLASQPAALLSAPLTEESYKIGPLAGVVVLILALALFFLARGMHRRIQRLDFDGGAGGRHPRRHIPTEAAAQAAEEPGSPGRPATPDVPSARTRHGEP